LRGSNTISRIGAVKYGNFRRVTLAMLGAASSLLPAEITEQELGAFQRPPDQPVENFAAKDANGVLAEIAGTASFEKWKTFEDDRVRFSYPAHEAITLEVKTDEPVPVECQRQ
jgi:hypothetical protein